MHVSDRKTQYLAGVRAGIPVILGFVPVGIAYAILARQAGFSLFETIFMSFAVFAGASQIMAVGMYTQGAGLSAIILATFILNLRHLIMSVCVVEQMRKDSIRWKLLAAFGVTDESFAIFTTRPQNTCSVFFFLGLISVTYSSWVGGTVIGAVASNFLPALLTASLGIALYAMFIGILIPSLKGNGKLVVLVLLTALCNSLLSRLMESSWALIVATLVCAAVGVFFVELPEDKQEGTDEH